VEQSLGGIIAMNLVEEAPSVFFDNGITTE
jgi:hypothetical protein